jgi:hypothetical protein
MYQPTKWKKEYRFVVIRRLIPEDPTEQLTLFSMGKSVLSKLTLKYRSSS